ncbi:MAG: Stp1/IreP family PP2C-type Ser/Thr phosphatase [Acidobacteriota bacterium]
MQIQYGSQTSLGRVRTSNEDSLVANTETGLALVADGMGGHAAGEVASQLAASTINEWVTAHDAASEDAAEMLRLGALEANSRVFEAQRNDRSLAGMGSTLTALLFRGDRYYIAHVGDSRAYRMRDGVLEQLTRDHSLVWHLYENGVLEKSDLAKHPQKNLITRSIGSHSQVEIDIEEGVGRAGDVYLLCSDGLTDGVTEEGLCKVLSDPDETPQEIANGLVEAANQAGGSDNITVVVIRLVAQDTTIRVSGKSRQQ